MTHDVSLILLAAHLVGDFVLQSDRMAAQKLTDPAERFLHCTLYTMCFLPALLFLPNQAHTGAFLALIALSHWLIDSRRWVRADHPWPPKAILVDQTLHVVVLAVVAAVFFG